MKYATSLLNKSAYSTNTMLDNQSIEWWFAVQGVEQAGGIEQGKNVGLVLLMDGWLIWGSSN